MEQVQRQILATLLFQSRFHAATRPAMDVLVEVLDEILLALLMRLTDLDGVRYQSRSIETAPGSPTTSDNIFETVAPMRILHLARELAGPQADIIQYLRGLQRISRPLSSVEGPSFMEERGLLPLGAILVQSARNSCSLLAIEVDEEQPLEEMMMMMEQSVEPIEQIEPIIPISPERIDSEPKKVEEEDHHPTNGTLDTHADTTEMNDTTAEPRSKTRRASGSRGRQRR